MFTAKVITVSDRSYRGEREDLGGPLIRSMLSQAGYSVGESVLGDGTPKALVAAVEDKGFFRVSAAD